MILYRDHLLPETETPLNKALAAVSTRYEGINAPVREFWDPWRCPAEHLKILAHAFSVDLWEDEWSDTRKRAIIANSIEMHRLKGTLAGLRAYMRFTPGVLRSVTVPPQKVFSGPSLTKGEREAWLTSLPQVRVWRASERGSAKNKVFSGRHSSKSFVGEGFFVPSTAKKRRSRRARYIVGGRETEERVTEFGSFFKVHIKSASPLGAFSNTPIGFQYFIPSTASHRVLAVQPRQGAPWKTPIRPSLRAVLSEPEFIRERGAAPASTFSGDPMGNFLIPSSAWKRIYWRFPVYDGSPMTQKRPSVQYMGLDRYGWPAHTARLAVSISGTKSDLAVWQGNRSPKQFWIPSTARDRIDKTRRGIIASKRTSDRIEMNFTGRRRLLAGLDILRAGDDTFIV